MFELTKLRLVAQEIEHQRRLTMRRGAVLGAIFSGLLALILGVLLAGCAPWPPAMATPTLAPSPTSEPTPMPSPTPIPVGKVCQVKTGIEVGNLNLRTGPGTNYSVITILVEGESLTITEDLGGWLEVTRANGQHGFINSTYCMKGE